MYSETLALRKRILAKAMVVGNLEILRLVETLLDQPGSGRRDPEVVGSLVRDALRVLSGRQLN